MRDGWERKVRSSSFFYQTLSMASRAREKMNKSPCSSRRGYGLAALHCRDIAIAAARLRLTRVTSKVLLFILLAAVPSGAAQEARYPAGTPARRYSSCHVTSPVRGTPGAGSEHAGPAGNGDRLAAAYAQSPRPPQRRRRRHGSGRRAVTVTGLSDHWHARHMMPPA